MNKATLYRLIILWTGFLLLQLATQAHANDLDNQFQQSILHLTENLHNPEVARGGVIASPSKEAPNYFSHWTRDAAITMDAVYELYAASKNKELKLDLKNQFKDWVGFEKNAQNQAKSSHAGYGEPRFNVDGTLFTGPWGRPQNDGPALRAITMTKWAYQLMQEGEDDWVKSNLYQSDFSANSVIKTDLEFVAHNWRSPCFDLWEEVNGMHFYTMMVQRKALLVGADFADKMHDGKAAEFYRLQAGLIQKELYGFFDQVKGYIVATNSQVQGWEHKSSQLDVAVVLGILHGYFAKDFLRNNLQWVTATMDRLQETFETLYPINRGKSGAPLIGRYPEDVYDGNGFGGGNPWFLATHAYAEFYCKLAKLEKTNGRAYRAKGIEYLMSSIEHTNQSTYEMSEQISRNNGYMMGASHLTWSYASYITAYLACTTK